MTNGGTNPCTEALVRAVIGRNAGTGFRLLQPLSERAKVKGIAEAFNSLNQFIGICQEIKV